MKCFVNFPAHTVNQQILAATKFGVSQNKVIWRLLNLASPRGPVYAVYDQFAKFAKYNSTPKFVDLQYHAVLFPSIPYFVWNT